MVARLAARIGKLEEVMPKPVPGCDACRKAVFFDGMYTQEQTESGVVMRCTSCRRVLPDDIYRIGGITAEEIL